MVQRQKAPQKKISTKFTKVLAIISILGFLDILLQSFFNISFGNYSTFLWLMVMGIGLIVITEPKKLYKKSKKRLNETNFSMLITFVLGCMAIIASILSFPLINLNHPILSATRGVISIIAIIFIIFEAWIVN